MQAFLGQFSSTMQGIMFLMMILNALLHLVFAAGIAKDVGNMTKRNIIPAILPGYAWVLAGLLGGILAVLAYWFVHHSSLARK